LARTGEDFHFFGRTGTLEVKVHKLAVDPRSKDVETVYADVDVQLLWVFEGGSRMKGSA
jgi:hypothetical protein